MVPQRPRWIGRPRCVRSNAWIRVFSSAETTTACSGGLRYNPTTSISFSTSCFFHDQACHPLPGLRSATTRRVLFNARNALLGKSPAPQRNRLQCRLQARRNLLIHLSFRSQQNDLRAQYQSRWRAAPTRPPLKRRPFFIGQRNFRRDPHGFILPTKDETPETRISSVIYESLH